VVNFISCCAGDYRQVHARLRENAEPVAFYGGIAREGVGVLDRFSRLMRHRLRVLRTQLRHSVVQVQTYVPGSLRGRCAADMMTAVRLCACCDVLIHRLSSSILYSSA
jgi:ABC transporter transmembrane region 2